MTISTDHSAEARLHEALGRWADAHRGRYQGMSVLEYDPDTYPYQRLDEFTTAAGAVADAETFAGLRPALRAGYLDAMGSRGAAALEALAGGAVVGEIGSLLAAGKSVAVLATHADGLDDVGIYSGGLALSFADSSLVRRNATILNKVMSREAYKGVPIADLFSSFATVYWVIPESEQATRLGVAREAAAYVNTKALRALVSDMRTGIAVTMAPTGTAMQVETDDDGGITAVRVPPLGDSTVGLMCKFAAYVVAGLWEERAALGPLTFVPDHGTGAGRVERQRGAVRGDVTRTMVELTESLADVPVTAA